MTTTPPYETDIRIEATPEQVYPYLTDPALVLRWMGMEASIDPAPGGLYRVNVNGRDIAQGEVVVADPPQRFVITWGWVASEAVPPGSTTVELTLEADGAGTIVRLTHRDLPADQVAAHEEGWRHFLPRLALAAAGGDAGPDPWAA